MLSDLLAANGKIKNNSMCLMWQETVKHADYWNSAKYKGLISRKQ